MTLDRLRKSEIAGSLFSVTEDFQWFMHVAMQENIPGPKRKGIVPWMIPKKKREFYFNKQKGQTTRGR